LARHFHSRVWQVAGLVLPTCFSLVAAACGGSAPSEESATPAEVPTIVADVGPVSRQTILDELVVRGTIAAPPNEDVKVSALVAGRVIRVTVAEGDAVREGQIVATLDPAPQVDQRREATAGVQQAKAALENAQANLQRTQHLFDKGIAAGKEVEDARKDLAGAQAGLEQATAVFDQAQRQVARAEVRSPINGQVVKRMVSGGEQVDGTAAQPIVEIANLDRVELAASVPSGSLPASRPASPSWCPATHIRAEISPDRS
jgi:membrane fusion protein, multidrug efflux system